MSFNLSQMNISEEFKEILKAKMFYVRREKPIFDFTKEQLELLYFNVLPKVYEDFYNKATNEKEKEILLDQVATLLVTCDKQLSIFDLYKDLEEKSKGHK